MAAGAGMAGFEAEPSEAQAIASELIAPVYEGWPGDAHARYTAFSSLLALQDAVVGLIAAERAKAVADMAAEPGASYRKLAPLLGMSAARAQQLAEAGRSAASRD